MRNFNKEIFLNAVSCPTLGWLARHEELPDSKPSPQDEFMMEQGKEIGELARKIHSGGTLIDDDFGTDLKKTKELMEKPDPPAIFEGTFAADGFLTKADILEREPNGWHMIEVKSGTSKDDYIDDAAYTTMVIEKSGHDISKVSLMLVSKDFRLGMDKEELFKRVECTEEVLSRVEEFQSLSGEVKKVTGQEEKPEPEPKEDCRDCDIFGECVGEGVENPVSDIPGIHKPKFEKLVKNGIKRVEDIPDDFSLTENQERVRDAVQSDEIIVDEGGLREELESIVWPAYYLDFETIQTAMPLYPDIRPWEQIPAQYSVHKCSEPGSITGHSECIPDLTEVPRKKLAEKLVEDLKGEGSIFVYTHFEGDRIDNLIEARPDLSEELNSLIDRLVDLQAIIENNFYHPDFHGSTSLKQVLPVLVPDLSYDELEISGGGSAQAALVYIAQGRYDEEKIETVRENLLGYCELDTLAMVKIHEKLVRYV